MIGTAKLRIFSEMTYYEIIKLSKESIYRLNSAGFKMEDWQYLELYEDYMSMHHAGEKMTYIVTFSMNDIMCANGKYMIW